MLTINLKLLWKQPATVSTLEKKRGEEGYKGFPMVTGAKEDKDTAGPRCHPQPYLARRRRLIRVKLGGGLGCAVP